ncbi:MAG TPA: iron ABC transporter substrate-binding protein [Pilimelia sp.]|nr:iron ABC transporter substrate-binding protein [Pilimelia sp.]
MRTPRRVLALAAVGAVALALVGCGDGGSDDASAPGDKKITIYSGRGESLVKPLLERFEKATGITVRVRYGDSAQLAAQLLEEGDRSPADVFLAQDAGALGAVAKAGRFATLPQAQLDKVPAGFRAADGRWVGVTGRSRVLVYHADQVSADQLPTSVLELTDPRWRGKVGIVPTNASFQAFVTALRLQHGEAKAREFLAGLKANEVHIRERNTQIVEDVNDGKLAAGLVNHYYVYEKAQEAGVDVKSLKARLHFFPGGDTGALVNVSGVGVLNRAGSDPDAAALVEFLLGQEAQTYFTTEVSEYPLAAGVSAAPGLPPLGSLAPPKINLNDLDTLAETVELIKSVGLA